MTQPIATAPATVEMSVYYRFEDYASLWRRIGIDVVEISIAAVVSSLLTSLAFATFDRGTTPLTIAIMCAWLGFWFVYFVLIKRSAIRTLGYRMGGVRIVNLRGGRPGLIPLTARLSFVIFAPMNYLVDLLWIGSDPSRQAIRDKFARTYVIRVGAQPAGRGEIRYKYIDVAGLALVVPEVVHSQTAHATTS